MTPTQESLLKQTIEHLRFTKGQLEDRIRVLDRENEDLIQKLKDAGVVARVPSLGLDRLPVLLESPDAAAVLAARAAMTPGERALLDRIRGQEEVMLLYQSQTKASVGLWLIERVVWVAVTREAVIFLASGRKPLAQRVSFLHLYESLYNPVTGELVLGPDRDYRVGQVRLPPVEGSQILAQFPAV